MAWKDAQEGFIRAAHLLHASPDVVFDELRVLGALPKTQRRAQDDSFEHALLERNDRLVDLGLAAFGSNLEVLRSLYQKSLRQPEDVIDEHYLQGLRSACLSNVAAPSLRFAFEYPIELVGVAEAKRLIGDGSGSETAALMGNPAIGEDFLSAVLSRKVEHLREGLVELSPTLTDLSERRWLELVYFASLNERLGSCNDGPHGPDLGYMTLVRAIVALLGTAPINSPIGEWPSALMNILLGLDLEGVHANHDIQPILVRWSAFEPRDHKGNLDEGIWTDLPMGDELRCCISATFGNPNGELNEDDVVSRCATYGNAVLNEKLIKDGFEKDGDTFAFAAIQNRSLYRSKRLRAAFEAQLPQGLKWTYRRRVEQFLKHHPARTPEDLLDEWGEDESSDAIYQTKKQDLLAPQITSELVAKRIAPLAEKLQRNSQILVVLSICVVVLAVMVYRLAR